MGRPKGSTKKNRAKKQAQSKATPKEKKAPKVVVEEKPVIEEPVIETPEEVQKEEVVVEEPSIKTEETVEQPTEPIKEETMEETATAQPTVGMDEDIPQEAWNPLLEQVVERDYTKDMIEKDMGGGMDAPTGAVEEIIPEPTYDNPFPEGDVEIPSTPTGGGSSSSSSSGSSSSEPKAPLNPALEDMPSGEKRKAAKKTAEALLTTYARVFPYPFKKISSFNMNKMERLEMAGEIDLKMVVTEDGKTVRNHMEAVNQQVEEVFVVTQEMQDELREPLIDLLMEQELALTPTQRLMMVLGGQAVQFTTATIQIAVSNRHALNTFKEFRAEQGSRRPNPQPQPHAQPQPQPTAHAEPTYDAPVEEVSEEEAYENPFGMDDYLSGNLHDEIASEENGQIVVEEEPNE